MGWFGTTAPQTPLLAAADEHAALEEAMKYAALIMHDETVKAEQLLSEGTSPFHKLGRAAALFVQAALGFEKDMAIEALKRLSESEDCASEHHRAAVRDPSIAFRSKIYPPGAEYALAHAESLCMSAVTGVLTESLIETLKGFNKLRKAYATLLELSAAEKKYLDQHFPDRATPSRSGPPKTTSIRSGSIRSGNTRTSASVKASSVKASTTNNDDDDDDDDDDDFVDAEETVDDTPAVTESLAGLALKDDEAEEFDFRKVSDDPVDIFIHSGICMTYGIFQLVLSLLPPPIAKFLAFIAFKGDKQTGLHLLWSATDFKENINGAIAAFVTAIYHNALVAPSDILRADDLPKQRLEQLLKGMEPHCEGSGLFTLEWSRTVSVQKDLEKALHILKTGPKTPLRQVEAFQVFESSFLHMYMHQYQECSASFEHCVSLNSWAHGLYYYIAAACQVELYRDAKDSDDSTAAEKHAVDALRLYELATANIGVKKVLGSKLPIDIFMERKIAKWKKRALTYNCTFLEAIGVSPVEEMIYLWSGYKKMQPVHLQKSLTRVAWSADPKKNPHAEVEPIDERALRAVIQATITRSLGQIEEGRAILEKEVLCYTPKQLKSCDHGEEWVATMGYYERAVSYWQEAGGETGDRHLLELCEEDIKIVEKSDSYEIEVMLGLKIDNARDALRRSGLGK